MKSKNIPPLLFLAALVILSLNCGTLDLKLSNPKSTGTEAPSSVHKEASPTSRTSQETRPPSVATSSSGALPTEGSSVPTNTRTSKEWHNNWLHFGVDNQYSSFNPNETTITTENISTLHQICGVSCDDGYFSIYGSTPAMYHGELIATHAGSPLEVIDPFSGSLLWQFGESAAGWAPPPVVSSDGIIYYLYVTDDSSTKLLAVSADTGKEIWEGSTQIKSGFNDTAQVTVDETNNVVYATEEYLSGDGRILAFDRKTGDALWAMGGKWEQDADPAFHGDIVLWKDNKLILPASIHQTDQMVRVDPATQKIDLQYDIPKKEQSKMNNELTIDSYGLCNDHLLESFNDRWNTENDILVAHSFSQEGIVWQVDISILSGRLACNTQKNIVYIPTNKALYALNADNGQVIWEHKSIGSVYSPTVANGIVYYLSDTNLYALNEADGKQLFRFPLGSNADPSTGVLVNDGMVIFSGSGGTCDLYILALQ